MCMLAYFHYRRSNCSPPCIRQQNFRLVHIESSFILQKRTRLINFGFWKSKSYPGEGGEEKM